MKTYTITQDDLDKTKTPVNRKWRYPGVTGPGRYTWSEKDHKYHPAQESEPIDFDTGLGIGGLGRHEEKPVIPAAAQIGHIGSLQKLFPTCRRCGQSGLDGAMFTTGGGNVCNDCF